MIHPLLTAYLDAGEAWRRDRSTRNAVARETAHLAWTAHVKANIAAVTHLLSLLADPSTTGPHISPDAPAEVWRAWRDVMGVDNG